MTDRLPGPQVLRLPAEPASVPRARRHATQVGAQVLGDRALADLALVISEVVTNAVRHGGGKEIALSLTPKGDHLAVRVSDGGAGFVPAPRATTPDDTGGFGLFLVERLTRRWGMVREGSATSVWFEI